MKKIVLPVAGFILVAGMCINSCKKDTDPPPKHVGATNSFTEEFVDFFNLTSTGWLFIDNSTSNLSGGSTNAGWEQGRFGFDKSGTWHGFSAFSYNGLNTEYAYSTVWSSDTKVSVSGWMITPVLSVKNGDKISFYTRCDTTAAFANRMQVRMAKTSVDKLGSTSALSTGYYKDVLLDINPTQVLNGYPNTWTKYEYTFTGFSENTDVRIGFRHYLDKGTQFNGIGVDQFRFQVN